MRPDRWIMHGVFATFMAMPRPTTRQKRQLHRLATGTPILTRSPLFPRINPLHLAAIKTIRDRRDQRPIVLTIRKVLRGLRSLGTTSPRSICIRSRNRFSTTTRDLDGWNFDELPIDRFSTNDRQIDFQRIVK